MTGFADLHTHWMAHMAFGGHLIWGQPTGDVAQALAPCNGTNHGADFRILGHDVPKMVLDSIVRIEAESLGRELRPLHQRYGFPDFEGWPTYATMCHQQMHIDWVRRAYEGGLRLMSVLAVNNRLLSWLMEARREHWDDDAIRHQLAAVKAAARSPENHEWMEIALSAADAERIVGADKLAIVLGVEVDQVELMISHDPYVLDQLEMEAVDYLGGRAPVPPRLTALAQSLHNLGVRQITPIHLADNLLGGPALYMDGTASNSHWLNLWRHGERSANTAGWPDVTNGPEGVEYKLQRYQVPFNRRIAFYASPVNDAVPVAAYADPALSSHVNSRGLTAAGTVFLLELWRRGIVVDVDHMSARAASSALELAERFGVPMIASHCSLQAITPTREELGVPDDWWMQWDGKTPDTHSPRRWPMLRHEGMRTDEDLRRLYGLGGVVGIIARQPPVFTSQQLMTEGGRRLSAGTTVGAASAYLHAVQVLGSGAAVALGTDMNGMNQAPSVIDRLSAGTMDRVGESLRPARPGGVPRLTAGGKRWNIGRDGMAHYGMLPDLIQQWHFEGVSTDQLASLMRSAGAYVETLMRAEEVAPRVVSP